MTVLGVVLAAAVLPGLFEGGDPSQLTKVPAPGVQMRRNLAMATSSPWVDSNIWQYRRAPGKSYFADVSGKSVELAMAEAHSQGVALQLKTAPDQREAYQKMLAFLKSIPNGPSKRWVNIAVSDDGSPQAGEAMNLLSRRNLLYQIGDAPGSDLKLALTKDIANPYDFMQETRQKLGDDKRIIRVFGSEITLADVRKDGSSVRVSLVNYASRPTEALRVRLRGKYAENSIRAYVYGLPDAKVTDVVRDGAYTEFSIPSLPLYAVIDLKN